MGKFHWSKVLFQDLRRRIRNLAVEGHKVPGKLDVGALGLELKRRLASRAPVFHETYDVTGKCVVRQTFPEVRQLPVFDIDEEQDCTLNSHMTVARQGGG
jgi:hypothetical protein